MTPKEARRASQAAEDRRQRAEQQAEAEPVVPAVEVVSDEPEEPEAELAPAVDAPKPQTCVCARVKVVSELLVSGHGRWLKGQNVPVLFSNATSLRSSLTRGEVEIVVAVPSPPHDTGGWLKPIDNINPLTDIAKFKRSGVNRQPIERRAKELALIKPSTAFAEKSPFDVAAEELFAKRNANLDMVRARVHSDYDFLLSTPAREVTSKRAEAERLMAEAMAAEAALPDLSGVGEVLDHYETRTALEPFVKLTNGEDVGFGYVPKDVLADAKTLVRSAIVAIQAGAWDTVATRVDELKKLVNKPHPGPLSGPGEMAIGGGY